MILYTLDANATDGTAREADAVGVCKTARHATRAPIAPWPPGCTLSASL